jgi:hypothetical protein
MTSVDNTPSQYKGLLKHLLHFYSSYHRVNIRLAIFEALLDALNSIHVNFPALGKGISQLADWIYVWFLKLLTPTFPFDPKRRFFDHYWWILLTGLALGYLLSFGANWLGSWISGTLTGPNTAKVEYFWTDSKNLLIYLIWAPLSCAFSFAVVMLVAKDWRKLKHFADRVSDYKDTPLDIARLPFSVSLLFWFALVITLLDYSGVMNTDYTIPKNKIYWYTVNLGNNKVGLNTAGYFHFGSNFIKMGLVIAAVLAYISFCIEILRTAASASQRHTSDETLKADYAYFVRTAEKLFLNMFLLAIILCCHHVIWRTQVSGENNSLNIAFAHVAIILGVIFMVEMPRFYIMRLSKKKEYSFYEVHDQQSQTLFAMKSGVVFLAARIILYLYIWSIYFEGQLGYSFFSRMADSIREILHLIDAWFGCILGRPCG